MTEKSYLYEQKLLSELKPSLRGADREVLYNKLWELLGLDGFIKCEPHFKVIYEKTQNGVKEIRFTFESEEGYTVPCHILFPEGIEKPVPVICIQGHSTGMHISLGRIKYEIDKEDLDYEDGAFAVRAVKEGFAAITIEQRYMGECGGTERGPSCSWQALPALLAGRCAIGERVWDVMRLIDVLYSEFSDVLSLSKLICTGNSGGGTTTFYSGVTDKRIKTCMPSCAFCTYRDSIMAMYHCTCNYIPQAAKYFDMGDLGGLIAPRQFIAIAGIHDEIFPIKGVEESFSIVKKDYEKAGCPENCRLIKGEGGHRFYADKTWQAYFQMNK